MDKRREAQIGDANFVRHQLVQQRLEQHLPAALVQESAYHLGRLTARPGGGFELQGFERAGCSKYCNLDRCQCGTSPFVSWRLLLHFNCRDLATIELSYSLRFPYDLDTSPKKSL